MDLSFTDFATPIATSSPADPRRFQPGLWIAALILLGSIALQCHIGLDSDVSWLITVGEHVLGGQRLYVDIVESNPPASVMIYLPAIALARSLGLHAELVVTGAVLLLAALSIGFSGRLLARAGIMERHERGWWLAAALLVFVLLPAACFAQREHIALLMLLPFIAIAELRARQCPVTIGSAIVAGVGAGITMAIKPHFVLVVGPMLLFAAWRRRSAWPLFGPEAIVAGAVVAAYAGAIYLFFPVYLSASMPLLKAVYLPTRAPFTELWLSAPMQFLGISLLLAVWLARRQLAASRAAMPLIGAIGFAAAAMVQGKGFLNHGYPYVALGLFGLAVVLIERHGDPAKRRFGIAAFTGSATIACWFIAHIFIYPGLADLIRRVAPPHPSIIAAGGDLALGHPATRWVDGRWMGRGPSLWVTADVMDLFKRGPLPTDPAIRERLRGYAAADAHAFVEDVQRGRPDVVLVEDTSGLGWINAHPDVARILAPYRPAGSVSGVSVWLRTHP